jgi:hypothetical protein
VFKFTLVVWLAAGGYVERNVEERHCREALALFQQSIATGAMLFHLDAQGRKQPVLDVRCRPKEPPALS